MVAGGIALVERGLAALEDESLSGEELACFARLLPRLDAVFASQVGVFDRSGAWALDGRRGMSGWLSAKCGMGTGMAHRVVRRAKFADECPLIGSRWAEGRVSTEVVDRIDSARHAAHDDESFAEFEPALVEVAMSGSMTDVVDMLTSWREALDNQRQDDDTLAKKQVQRQHLYLSKTFQGMGVLSGEFTPLDRESIETALDREMERLFVKGDDRTVAQRRAEALVSILDGYNSQLINKATNQPHISVHVDFETFTGISIGTCSTARDTRLARDTVLRMACDAVISIITHEGNSKPLNLYRAQRTFSRHQRRALEYSDGGCRYPGCTRNATQTEIHHVNWWEFDGDTNIDNAALLCHWHHKMVHELKWSIKIDEHANIEWYKPDGSYHATSYPKPPPQHIPIRE